MRRSTRSRSKPARRSSAPRSPICRRRLADELRLDTQAEGVVITAVADGSTAQSVGFQKGDIIVAVNNQKIDKPADLERAAGAGGRQWRITIIRGGQQISVMFSG